MNARVPQIRTQASFYYTPAEGCVFLPSHARTSACKHHELLEVDRHRRAPPPTGPRRVRPVARTEPAQSLASVAKNRRVEPLVEPLLLLQGVRGALRPVST